MSQILHLPCPGFDNRRRPKWQKISEFRDVFALKEKELGDTLLVSHIIDTDDSPPLKLPPPRMAAGKSPAMRAEVEDVLKRRIIRPYDSRLSL